MKRVYSQFPMQYICKIAAKINNFQTKVLGVRYSKEYHSTKVELGTIHFRRRIQTPLCASLGCVESQRNKIRRVRHG